MGNYIKPVVKVAKWVRIILNKQTEKTRNIIKYCLDNDYRPFKTDLEKFEKVVHSEILETVEVDVIELMETIDRLKKEVEDLQRENSYLRLNETYKKPFVPDIRWNNSGGTGYISGE